MNGNIDPFEQARALYINVQSGLDEAQSPKTKLEDSHDTFFHGRKLQGRGIWAPSIAMALSKVTRPFPSENAN